MGDAVENTLNDAVWEIEMCLYDRINKFEERFNNDIWTTLDDQLISLEDMSTSHIKNCIRYIQKHGNSSCYGYGGRWLSKLKKELRNRG